MERKDLEIKLKAQIKRDLYIKMIKEIVKQSLLALLVFSIIAGLTILSALEYMTMPAYIFLAVFGFIIFFTRLSDAFAEYDNYKHTVEHMEVKVYDEND